MKTQQDVRWLSLEPWDACGGLEIDPSALEGKECFAGLDLSTTTDVSALVLVLPGDDGAMTVLPRFWIPADNARKRERRDRVPYQTWARQDFIEMTPGNVIDYEVIRQRVNKLGKRFKIREIAIDRWNTTQLSIQLQGDGFAGPLGAPHLRSDQSDREKNVKTCKRTCSVAPNAPLGP